MSNKVQLKKCSRCNIDKNINDFYNKRKRKDSTFQKYTWCKSCSNEYRNNYFYFDRLLVIKHYSKNKFECNCCGENNIKFLTIDHINRDGAKQRKELKSNWGSIVKWIIDNDFPDGYQILCWNCNCAREKHNGICPHKLEIYNEEIELLDNYLIEKKRKENSIQKNKELKEYKKSHPKKYLKNKPGQRKCIWPTKEELIELIENNTWVEIGRQYGVCNNSVKKWAKKYNII